MMEQLLRIAVIDDDPDFLFTTATFLEHNGYEVHTAEDGPSGIRLSEEKSCPIVMTDIKMPGMDGIEILKRIKGKYPEKEVIVATAYGEMDLAVRALRLDASDFITKPVKHAALLLVLERAKTRYRNRKKLQDYTTLLEERWMDTAEELARMVAFQTNMIESSIDGIMGLNREGKVVTFNKSLEEMLGFSRDEAIGKMFFDRFFQGGEAKKFKESLHGDGYGGKNRLFLFETNLVSKTGDKIPVQLSATVLFEEGEEIGMVGFFRDLREMRRMEQQFADQTRLLHEDKMISLGRLSASVAHEINNPLSGILNYIRLMIKIIGKGSLAEEHLQKFQRYVSVTESETAHCAEIVSNLLAFSRKSELMSIEIDINELLDKCIMLGQHKMVLQNIQIEKVLNPNIPKVMGNLNQIQQCVINLIFNAVDAMPEGGHITLATSFDSKKDLVEIRIEDNGCGISPENLPRILDPFFTTKKEGQGLGLGLSTVYGIIARHKGSISVDSVLGRGSVFTVRLPVTKTRMRTYQ